MTPIVNARELTLENRSLGWVAMALAPLASPPFVTTGHGRTKAEAVEAALEGWRHERDRREREVALAVLAERPAEGGVL